MSGLDGGPVPGGPVPRPASGPGEGPGATRLLAGAPDPPAALPPLVRPATRLPFDLVLAGVGGQGVLTAAALVTETARRTGLTVRQGEIHGMSQRGGAVTAHVRVADGPVRSEVVERGAASMILALEPLEALRSLPWLDEGGVVVSAASPLENIPGYPPLEEVLAELRRLPGAVVVDARAAAREAGSVKAENVVLLGAAARWLPFPAEALREVVAAWFGGPGDRLGALNLRAFDAGLAAGGESGAPG